MNKRQENYSTMATKVYGVANRHKEIWKNDIKLSETFTQLSNLFPRIKDANIRQNRKTTGITKQKNLYRDKLNLVTNVFLAIFRSYAKITGNEELYENSDLSITEIKIIKDAEIMLTVDTVISYATDNLDKLKEYSLTEEMITEYKEDAVSFVEYLTLPQQIKAECKTATQEIKNLLKTLEVLVTQLLDNLMVPYKIKEPQFYGDYVNARIIYDDPTISKSLMGQVTDLKTGEPLKYVDVIVTVETHNKIKEVKKVTTEKGNFQFKGLPTGKCKVKFVKNYYDTLTVASEINPNDLTRLNATINKSEQN